MKHSTSVWKFLLLSIIALPGRVQAGSDIFVSPSGSNTHPYSSWATAAHSIQDAVDASSLSDRVIIGNGSYNIASTITITNAITLESLNGASAVTVDAGGLCRGFNISHAGAVIRGLSVTGGSAGVGEGGGGIMLSAAACVDACVITDNNAYGGGGIYCEAGGVITNCLVSYNHGSGYYFDLMNGGGGIKAKGAVLITMCEISDNTCNNSGGGVEFALEDFGDPGIMELCRVHNNTAELMSGGGVHVRGNGVGP
jgi:hypothetical protein